jgi:hypothetical protein
VSGFCIHCGQWCELAADGALEDESGACGCSMALENGQAAGEHEVDELAEAERAGAADEEQLADWALEAAYIDRYAL